MMPPRTAAISATLTTVLLAGTSCSDNEAGMPITESPPATTQTSEPTADVPGVEPPPSVPKVTDPIQNVKRFISKPCDTLTHDQAAQLKLDAKIEENLDNDQGPQCRYFNEKEDRLSVVFSKRQPLGIAGLYLNNQNTPGFYKYFEPVDIAGHPGVFADAADDRPNGLCALSVGLTDKQTVTMTLDIRGEKDPCSILKKAAEFAVKTMKQG